MKKILIILNLLFFGLSIPLTANIDSLKEELKISNINNRRSILINLAKELSEKNLTKASIYIKEAVESSGNTLDSLSALSYFHAGGIYMDIGLIDSAVSFYRRSIKISAKLKDTLLMARALSNLGIAAYSQSDFAKALSYYQSSNIYYKKLKDEIKLANNLVNIGNVKVIYGKTDTALSFYKSALKIYKKENDPEGYSKVLLSIGDSYLQKSDYTKAVNSYEKAVEIFENQDKSVYLAKGIGKLGNAYYYQGNLTKALELHLKALKISEEAGDMRNVANTYITIGIINKELSKKDVALKYFSKARDIYSEISDNYGLSYSYSNMANIYFENKDYDKAYAFFQRSSKLFRETGDKSGYAGNLIELANIHLIRKNHYKAFNLYQESLNICNEIGDKAGAAKATIQICKIYMKNKHLNKCIKLLEKIKPEAELIDNKVVLSSIYELLADAYAGRGKYDKAFKYHKFYSAVKDSILNDSKTMELGKMQALYEFEKEKRESEITEKERKRKTAEKISYRNNIQYSGIFLFVLLLFIVAFFVARMHFKPTFIEGVVFITFLLFYEFILLIIEPSIDKFTTNIPIYKLIINVVIAFLFIPIHNLERKLRLKYLLTVRNKPKI